MLGEGGAECFMALGQDIEGLLQCGLVQSPLQADHDRRVVGGALRVHLPEQPLPLLGMGGRQRPVTLQRLDLLFVDEDEQLTGPIDIPQVINTADSGDNEVVEEEITIELRESVVIEQVGDTVVVEDIIEEDVTITEVTSGPGS